jgi:alpha-tubulin suppressor-like RCC1 family protein
MSLYVWGSNKSKQLNTQKDLHCYAPVYVPGALGDNIPSAVASGESHTLVLCESGDLFSFGRGREGQLGHGLERPEASEVMQVVGLDDETVIEIAAGSLTSYAVTSTGNVYHWYEIVFKMFLVFWFLISISIV